MTTHAIWTERLMTERQLQDAIVTAAKLGNWLVFHPWTSMHSAAGWPDLAMVRGAQLIFAELKKESASPTPAQRTWLDALRAVPGVEVYCWRPSDLDGAIERLTRKPPSLNTTKCQVRHG